MLLGDNAVNDKLNINQFLELPLSELVSRANEVKRKFLGNNMEVCSIINAKSGSCSEDCKFCGQSSKYTTNIDIYPLENKDKILEAAENAKKIGAKKFGIVSSGNKLSKKELDILSQVIRQINEDVGMSVCASLGALEKDDLFILKEAGMVRYHHNIETSRRFYPEIVSTHSFDERINTIKVAKEVGLEVCSGGIIGMGETWQDRVDMAILLKELDVDSVPINILVPIKGTPLESLKPLSCSDAVRTICIFRIILEDKIIKIAAGRESVLKDFQALGFMGGANGMLIGGYLTLRGRDIEEDFKLIEEIKNL